MSLQIFNISTTVKKHQISHPGCEYKNLMDKWWYKAREQVTVDELKKYIERTGRIGKKGGCLNAEASGCCNTGQHGRARKEVLRELDLLPTAMVSQASSSFALDLLLKLLISSSCRP